MLKFVSLFAITAIGCLFFIQPKPAESKNESPKFQSVWTAKFSAKSGTPIDDRYFTQSMVRTEHAPGNAIVNLPENHILSASLGKGEFLRSDEVVVPTKYGSPCLPQGFKIIGLFLRNIDDRTEAVIGIGDRVDVIGRLNRVEKGIASTGVAIIAYRVVVFSVCLRERHSDSAKSMNSKCDTFVGLLVADDDAKAIFNAQRKDWQLSMTLHRD